MSNSVDKKEQTVNESPVYLKSNALKDTTFGLRQLHCIIPYGVTLEQILEPTFWKHNAQLVSPRTQIFCEFEDGSRFLWLVVVANDRTWVKTEVILDRIFSEDIEAEVAKFKNEANDYRVQWMGIGKKYAVIRVEDNEVIKDGLNQKEEAYEWLEQFKASLSR